MLDKRGDGSGGHVSGEGIDGYTGDDMPPLSDPGESLPF